MKILKILSFPFVAIGGFLLMAWYFVNLGEAKERDRRHQESLKQKQKNKKEGERIEKKYEAYKKNNDLESARISFLSNN